MRVDLIGPGDINFHFHNLLSYNEEKLEKEVLSIANVLKKSDVEICLLPDAGISLEVAKKFKENGGKVTALIPKNDTTFGIKHLQPYIDIQVNEKNLFDSTINTGDWFKHDLTKCLFGDIVLCLGLSPGTDGERAYGIYLYKLVTGYKKGVKTSIRNIHPEARAGTSIPFTIIFYKPFMKSKISVEEEKYCEKFGIKLFYAESSKDLENLLKIK